MDMMPPQAPPALTQSAYDDATKHYDRLTALQAWIATEQASLPALAETIGETTLGSYQADVDAYWRAPPTQATGDLSRRAAFTHRIAGAARDVAELAHHDGNLDAAALTTIRAVASVSPTGLPTQITVREAMFGETPYAGVLLIQDAQLPGRILAFSTDHGWEAFGSLTEGHAAIEQRARQALVQARDLPGLARQNTLHMGADTFVTSRDIDGDPFATLVDRLIDVQRDKLHQAAFEFVLAGDGTSRTADLVDATFDAVRLDRAFDVAALLATRHAALLETFNDQRLARVPATVASDWRQAEDDYRSRVRTLTGHDSVSDLPPALDLPGYARQVLGEELKAIGITEEPADIQVRVDRNADPAAPLQALQGLFDGSSPARIGLLDLAYQNIASFDPVRLVAESSDGTAMASLGDAALRQLIRRVDLSSRYRAYVNTTFLSGPLAAARRHQAADVQRARMLLQAAEARLSYYLTGEPRSFRPDRAERGYRWVKAVLDAPAAAHRARVEGHEIVVRHATYRGAPLREILTIGVRRPESVASIVLYTPDAPDGITYREFDDRAEAGRRFFYNPAFREYLLDRLPVDHARVLPQGYGREFAGDHLAHWVLGSPTSSRYTRTEEAFEEREVPGDFLDAAYVVDVQSSLRNAHIFTRSAEQANWAWLVDVFRTGVSDHIIQQAVEGVVTAPARAAQAAWRLYDNVKAGDHAGAFVDFADFYNASLMAATPVYGLSSVSVARGIVGGRFRAAGRLVEARPPRPAAVTFESRFLARNVRRTGRPDREGVYTVEGKHYIEHDGQLYAVRRDADYATWRLARPEGGPTFYGPAIQRSNAGAWGYHRVGLRGGSGRPQGSRSPRPDAFDSYADEIERAFPDPFERDLVGMHMQVERAGGTPSPAITTVQRQRWNESFARAQQRERASRALPMPSATTDPNLSLRPDYVPMPLSEAPPQLWHYGRLPLKDSTVRMSRNVLSNRSRVEIASTFVGPELQGVRFTSLPPTAPIGQIRNAMGRPDLVRSTTFAIRIDTASLGGPLHHSWQQQLPYVHDIQADLFRSAQSSGTTFIARPTSWGRQALYFGDEQFQVVRGLPPQASR
jgi:hypothetical protein